MREDARTKGLRLLVDGRLFVREVNPATGYIYAECRGDSGEVYDLGWNPWKKKWGCTCQARTDCSHLWALRTVCTLRKNGDAPNAIDEYLNHVSPVPHQTSHDSKPSALENEWYL